MPHPLFVCVRNMSPYLKTVPPLRKAWDISCIALVLYLTRNISNKTKRSSLCPCVYLGIRTSCRFIPHLQKVSAASHLLPLQVAGSGGGGATCRCDLYSTPLQERIVPSQGAVAYSF